MGFLKIRFSHVNAAENLDTLSNLDSYPPETLYDNEAWAPETEFIGLFRKRRVNAEKKILRLPLPNKKYWG